MTAQPANVPPGGSSGPARLYAVIAGGGTAGHVLPGVAVGQALVRRGHAPNTLLFVGSGRGVERTVVPAAGFELMVLPGRGIARRLTVDNIGAVVGLARAVWQAVVMLRHRRPAVVLSLGGYASVACTIGAVLWRIPLVVTEQNAVAGLANKLAGRFARCCAVPFDGTDLPRPVVTGNPVRAEVEPLGYPERRATLRAEARHRFGVGDDTPMVVVFSGSLGARRVNLAAADLARLWQGRHAVLYLVTGTRDHDLVLDRLGGLAEAAHGVLNLRVVPYEDRMHEVLAAADVVVCRSGGTTVAELAVAGVPAVLVPLPGAPRDHQRANARPLVNAGGAIVLDDADCTAVAIDALLVPLLEDPVRRATMTAGLGAVARPDAADRVAELVESHARVR
jgi:UDP-N-acetylglucosamine--N-acetylmuramyl-(pentapeptide) pyrophosphoryl-undecaprenol N-acetylglucosamine transferase